MKVETLTQRGFNADAFIAALLDGNEDKIGLAHPINWMTEDEAESPALDSVLTRLYEMTIRRAREQLADRRH